MANIDKDFVITSQVKDYIYFDGVNNQFKINKYQFKKLFSKPKIHSFSEIAKIKLLDAEDDKYCAELEIVIVLKNNTKYYIGLIKKPTSKRSLKYKRLNKIADEITSYLEFVQYAGNINNSFTSKPTNPINSLMAQNRLVTN